MSLDLISLADTASCIVDNRGKTVPTIDKGIPLIKTNCITNEQLYPHVDGAFYISQEIYDTWFRAHPKPGDIILTLKGSQNGAACLVPNPVSFVIAQDMVAIRVNEKVINAHYLLAALRSREVQHQIKTLDVSGVIPHLKKTDFDKLILPYPSREIQDYIGQLYHKLSTKIELLRHQNHDLEELAKTLFKRWFVEFEFPNENGEPYKSSGGKMVASELGEIPEGWRFGELSELLEIKYGKDHKHLADGNIPVYGSGGIMRYVNEFIYDKPSILLPRKGTLSNLFYLNEPFWSVDTMFYSKIKKEEYGKYCFQLLKTLNLSLMDVGSAVPSLSTSVLNGINVLIPYMKVAGKFEEALSSLFNKKNTNQQEIQTLTQLRDALLPKLVSGELRIKVL